jgi:hypothetical protein
MVPICFRDNWRSISGKIGLPGLHCNHIWYESCVRSPLHHTEYICSGPRFALVSLWYVLTKRPNSSLPKFILGTGIFRTLTCGGWTYVTSTDDHDWHDIFMISYLVATLPWTIGCLLLSPDNAVAIRYRKIFGGAFFATLVPLIYFFIQHKVHRVPGGENPRSQRTTYPKLTSR